LSDQQDTKPVIPNPAPRGQSPNCDLQRTSSTQARRNRRTRTIKNKQKQNEQANQERKPDSII